MNEQPYQAPMAPPQYQVTYAGFWKRFAAYLIDEVILAVVAVIILAPFIALIGISTLMSSDEYDNHESFAGVIVALIAAYFFAIVLIVIAKWLYYSLMESKKGATIGKMALGIKVTDMNGNMISFGRATGRYFGKILSGLTLCIGYIIAGFSQQKQALHDILAKTLVVNKHY